MGEAKRRGTFLARKLAAEERKRQRDAARPKHDIRKRPLSLFVVAALSAAGMMDVQPKE